MDTGRRILNVKVGETLHDSGRRAAAVMKALAAGKKAEPYFGVSFEQVGQMFAALRAKGPLSVADLARQLGRNYKNVHTDVQQLIEWMAVERGDDGRVSVPWSDIVVGMKLPQGVAA